MLQSSTSGPHSAVEEPFQPGTVVAGKYLVERRLAEGGIGIVVVARQLELNRRVAIKYLHRRMLASPAIVERFRREAQLAASINSDHVVRIFDVGVLADGSPFMVMEHLDGEDLGSVLARGALEPELAVDYLLQACDAIAEAHALGIVHRDLKPENLFLAQRCGGGSIVKILDFGISKASTKSDAPRMPSVTEVGERFGTPIYMSPEQLLSSTNVDARADIWALGVVLFELLTGSVPFAGEEVPHLCANILASPAIPLRALRPDASRELEAVVLKCLDKDPARRYRNVAELALDLVSFGPPSSRQLVESITRSVRYGGSSIRPPSARVSAVAEDLRHSTDATLGTAIEAAASSGRSRPRTRAAAIVTATAVALALLITVAAVAARDGRAPVERSVQAFGLVPPPEVDARGPDQRTVPPVPAEAERPTVASAAPAAVAEPPAPPRDVPFVAQPARPPSTRLAAHASATPARPPPPPPPPMNRDYMEFGERR